MNDMCQLSESRSVGDSQKTFLGIFCCISSSELFPIIFSDISDISDTPSIHRGSRLSETIKSYPDSFSRSDSKAAFPLNFFPAAAAPLRGARIGGDLPGKTTPSATAPQGPAGYWEKWGMRSCLYIHRGAFV